MKTLWMALAATTLSLTLASAQEAVSSPEAAASSREVVPKVKNETLKAHLLQNVDIFGKTDLSAIYILAPGETADEEIKGAIITRDFSRDAFFMQNIDREEFEFKMTLRDFDEDKVEGIKAP